ncbi:Mucin 5, subtypes A and C, tracheobronchial/gastric [Apodemus speciosus]|uniref:Mucin 5, subtypes A and C, tracheobronchial/gastric n=1 Tax=Apodemus speciosus TaxID=105296 RepID=A0ABQ0F135_APOSI
MSVCCSCSLRSCQWGHFPVLHSMGVGRRKLVPFWVLALALACSQHTGQAQQDTLKSSHEHRSDFSHPQGHVGTPLDRVTIIPPLKTFPVVRALNPAHTRQVCSTWGNFHYKTFDGQVFYFPGLCNYVFSAHCGDAYEDFNIQLRRGQESNSTTLSRVTMKLDGLVVELTKSSVLVNNHPVQLPFSQSGVLIELSNGYLKVVARLGLLFMWNDDDSLLLELDTKYTNKTCGLCGDFNGSPKSSEFLSHNVRLTPLEFGNLQKMDGPTEQCQDPLPVSQKNCSTRSSVCEKILKGQLFSDCAALVDISSYLEACQQDLCLCESSDPSDCICHTLAEYSRQCTHAGGQPQDWRGPNLCPQTCPLNMQHQECGTPCVDTCSNPQHSQVCEDHCVAGCFCPEGMVLDDINQTGCVPVSQCACLYNGTFYAPGTNYSTDCTKCTCSGGQWSCQEVPCSGACSVLGGSHISTFDERQYTVHGDCTYVLSKPCNSNVFTVLAELRKCGLTESETCLKTVTLNLGGGQTVVMVKATGEVFVNQIYTQLPVSTANVTFFRPSTFFIIGQTNLGLQLEIQLNPIMQVSVRLTPELRGLTCGLCGNFNSMQADDFQTISGVVEGTAAAFFNTFKTQAACPNVKNIFEDPCSLSVENEKYAQHWCSQLTNASGPFSQCHATVNPSTFFSNCMFDTCNCEKSEDCMCAALSSYVRACAAKGVLLSDWRDGICTKPAITCPKSMTYQYHISTCQPTCRSLTEEDVTCHVNFIPVDGCTCPKGTFLDDSGKCVQATSCPCYYKGSTVPNGESVHDSGTICTCTQGALTLCDAPMIYFDCRNATSGDTGAGCQKSCHTLDMTCYSSECVPGCVCPNGLVADGNGGCVVAEDCPCVHNEATYRPGETIQVGCNNCTCENRMWQCTDKPCLATCAVYGDGHYITFDGQRYSFNGDCEYTLLQDNCGGNGSSQHAFRVVTENIPCGTTGTTCSKGIKIFLGNYELKLSDSKMEVVQKDVGQEPPYFVHQMGNYLVVETDIGLVLLWDKKTSIFLRLSPEFKGKVCGLCGNFDDNAINDFTTRSQSVVSDMLEFGNSWKLSPSCPDVLVSKDPCTANPYRKSWAQKQCSIINSATFSACHAHVEPAKYYEACVNDACACDSGGDCECFCTAVAAYAQACHEVGVCVSWRTPDICPLFCDYYNPEGQCEWHYQPCGAPCMRTCQNPTGQCLQDLRGLEGAFTVSTSNTRCYPKCPPTAPIFDEGTMQCVSNCTVTPSPIPPQPCRVNGKLFWPGASVPSDKNCQSCICTESGVNCTHDAGACVCIYNGQQYHPGDIIYHTTDGMGGCISAHCLANGTIDRRVDTCSSTTSPPPTTFSFSTPLVMTSMRPSSTHSSPTPSVVYPGSPSKVSPTTSNVLSVKTPATGPILTTSTSASTVTTSGCQEECLWSPWMDVSRPGRGIDSGDFDTLENLRAHGYQICQVPKAVECRAEDSPEVPLHMLQQHLECSTTVGLTCYNRDQESGLCDNYQIKVQCCTPISCPTSSGPTQTTHLIASRTTTIGDTTSSVPVTSTEHAYSTVTSGPSPSSSVPSSPAPAPSTPAPVTSTTVKTTLTTTSPTPKPTPATSSVSISTSGSTRASFETTHECKQELCHWTDWIDGSYPGPSRNSGDFDTFVNLRSKGYKFCEKPRNVECRAQFFPNTPLEELGQDVICNREEGLLCLNKNQLPPICYNYEIRIECCTVVNNCSTDSTTRQPPSHGVSPKTKSSWTTTMYSSSTKDTRSHSAVTDTKTLVSGSPHTTTQPVTTHCQPQCNWTKWFDTDFPVPGPHGGDLETYSNILRSGERLCHRPEEITQLQCRAENSPEIDIKDLGQVVQCDPSVGLVCNNRDQEGDSGMCLNYEVRVLCCHVPEGCPTTTHATLPSTPSETVTSSAPGTTSMHRASSTSMPQTRTNIVQTHSTTSAPHTSSPATGKGSTTHQTQTSSTPIGEASTSSGHTASTVSTRGIVHKSTRSVQTASTTSTPQTSSTSKGRVSTTPRPQSSSTHIGKTSTTSTTQSSTTSGPTASTVSTRDTSTSSGHTASPTSKPKATPTSSTISPRDTRTSSLQTDSTTSTSQTSSPNTGKGSTAHKTQSSSTPIAETSTISTSPSSGQTAHTTFVGKTSTLSGSGTSTTSVPTSTTGSTLYSEVTYSPVTTHCQPQCNWTKWFDTDFPVPGPHGGDLETYSNILRSGERLCHRPEEITQLQCRAENSPEIDIKDLGQVVQCDPSVGLVCNNRDQEGNSGMCLNYEVRVLCCHIPEGCPGTDRTPVTLSHKPSFPVVSPTSVSPSLSTSPRVHSTTPCFCSVSGQLYPLGSIIYNQTDLDGYCYYSICSQDCQVVKRVSQACPSTMPPPTPTLSTSTTPPVTEQDWCNVFPPRLKGETWPMPNCSQVTCEGNNVISLSPRQCPELKEPSCANGYPPLKVDDQDGCCQHYQCQCVCSGWGDPHYITFDGTYYTFLDNCTYVLVQQIVPVFGYFRVLIDNYFCDLGDSVTCPQSIIVEYHQDRVVLTRRPVSGVMTNQIIFNNKVVSPGFQHNGIVVSRMGIKMYVTIQEIGVRVMFSGLIFSVEVPFNLFANNTEGQCGTCTNDKKDECRLPGGSIASSCAEMSHHWKVPNQPSCQGPPPTPTSVVPKLPPTPCPPSPLCQLIISDVFKLCHDIIPPRQFYEGCLFDSCHKLELEVFCSALELYASLCAAQGVCIPWRSHTNNTCSFTCSGDKVYQPCGPSNPHYCYRTDDISPSLLLQEAGPKSEGCFCPDNMTLFSTNHSVCVPSCQWCLGPHGEPVEPGRTISIDCQDCVCKEATLTCRRKPCPQPTCTEPGFVPVPVALEAGQCCPQYSCGLCACNSSHCPPPLHCPENSSLIVTYEEGACCPSQNCSSCALRDPSYSQYIFWTGQKGCEVNGTLYQPGDVVSSGLCERCLCEVSSNPLSGVFMVNCETELCNTQCPKGFEYQAMPGQCCGQCVQKTCPFKNSSNSTHYYKPGELWSEPGNPCITHKCEKFQDVFVVVTTKTECPKINCPPGQAQLREDGCCYDCLVPQQKCTVHQRQQIIRQQNCSSEGPVSISYCQGNCGDSTSMYSLEANTVEHTCECCQELQTSQRSVTLRCDDGSSRTFSYTQVEKCGCLGQRCQGPGDTSHAEFSEQEFKSKESEEHGQQSAVRVGDNTRGPFQ